MDALKVIPVVTKKDRKEFVEYPLRLYKGNPYFVPPFYSDEMKLFTDKNIYTKTCTSSFFLAKRGNKTVGRIQGIVQKQYNALRGVTQARLPALTARTMRRRQRLCLTPWKSGQRSRAWTRLSALLGTATSKEKVF